jgi:glyoxylase-like metal-dependent hydrolase (beta-lactamase superfamily II)
VSNHLHTTHHRLPRPLPPLHSTTAATQLLSSRMLVNTSSIRLLYTPTLSYPLFDALFPLSRLALPADCALCSFLPSAVARTTHHSHRLRSAGHSKRVRAIVLTHHNENHISANHVKQDERHYRRNRASTMQARPREVRSAHRWRSSTVFLCAYDALHMRILMCILSRRPAE